MLMETCKGSLEKERPLKTAGLTPDQLKAIENYQFFTMKPVFIVVNVEEGKIKDTSLAKKISEVTPYPAIQLSAGIEQEISTLDAADRESFMKDLGIVEPAIHKMTMIAYSELGLISFFTVGEDEVRAWTVRRGASAPEAARAIHTDIEKGFVRAEMFKYDDLIAAGNEAKLKEQGKFYLKGKDYIVEDGDILSFRSSI